MKEHGRLSGLIVNNMSLCYSSELCAWKQRLSKEVSAHRQFARTYGNLTKLQVMGPRTKLIESRSSSNYRGLRFNMSYAFGGTKPIQFCRAGVSEEKPVQVRKHRSPSNLYANELEKSILKERGKRMKLERKTRDNR